MVDEPTTWAPTQELQELGWREWVRLPELGLPDMRVKIDTGAKTSAIHAFEVATFERDGKPWVRFKIRPRKRKPNLMHTCEAEIIDRRYVKDSGGHQEERYVIKTEAVLGKHRWPIEMTLTDRDTMNFRMLLGRRAMTNRFVVNPAASFMQGLPQIECAQPLPNSKPTLD